MPEKTGWLPIAVAEEVNDRRPLNVAINGFEFALFRDGDGKARAVENRCPHRRVPLTLGKIIAGNIRCAYHGWTFDGASGNCVEVPNFGEDERISSNFQVRAFPVLEHEGFVSVVTDEGQPPLSLPFEAEHQQHLESELAGSGCVPMGIEHYRSALLDGPQVFIEFPNIRLTDFFLGDVMSREDRVVIDREAEWGDPRNPAAIKIVDRPLILRTEMFTRDNVAIFRLLDEAEQQFAVLLLAYGRGKRGTTTFCWRYRTCKGFSALGPKRFLPSVNREKRFKIHTNVNGESVSELLVGPSHDFGRIVASLGLERTSTQNERV